MKYSDVKSAVVTLFKETPDVCVYISGPPGIGKTHLRNDVAKELSIPSIKMFRPSLHDPSDLVGVPSTHERTTVWNPPAWFHKLTTGRHLLMIDEIAQCSSVTMFNALAGLILDRQLDDLALSPDVYMMATGNRIQDRAGARQIPGQLTNRWMHLEMEADHKSWERWALTHGIDPVMVAFLRFRPGLLMDYQPDRHSNPTPRSWELVNRIPASTPGGLYLGMVAGLVGEGAATEFVGYRSMAAQTPDPKDITDDPQNAPVPTEPGAKYAVSTCLAVYATTPKLSEAAVHYIGRMDPEFQVLFFSDCMEMKSPVCRTRAFAQWGAGPGAKLLG